MSEPLLTLSDTNVKSGIACVVPRWVRVVGILAGIVTSLAFSQQSYVLWFVEHKATTITWVTLVACVIGQSLWMIYGFGSKDPIIMTVAGVTLTIWLSLIGTKIRWRK